MASQISTVDFKNQTVVVTGGNRGIGFAISETLAKAGANVAIIFRSAKDAHDVAAKLAKDHGTEVKAWQCDVGNTEQVTKTFEEINSSFGQITSVVANAGVSIVKPATELTYDDYKYIYDVNVWGQFATAQAAAKLWIKSGFKKGSIVLTSSMSTNINNKGITQAFYNSSKGAASNLVRQLAVEWAPNGIRVNALSPGYVATDQTSHMDPKLLKWQQSELIPLQRFSTPEEQAYMTLLLLDPVMGG
ncbi:hypothetical protein EMMF5_003484 [Cystobasidiomycetes sp. EMM_F5]